MVAEVNKFRDLVQERLDRATRQLPFKLSITGDRQVDGWLQFVVTPDRDGIDGNEYVRVLSQIEQDLEKEHEGLHLLLLPAIPND